MVESVKVSVGTSLVDYKTKMKPKHLNLRCWEQEFDASGSNSQGRLHVGAERKIQAV